VIRFFKTPHLIKKLFFRRLWGFSISKKSIYLTFDDGPHPEITTWILDYLTHEKIQATFFCVGDNVRKYPEIYARIIKDGHAVGNHTMYHNKARTSLKKEYFDSINKASDFIESTLFRPPYGRLPFTWEKSISKKYKIVMWSWLSYDFDQNISVETILKKAKKIKSGDILVLHDNPKINEKQKELLPKLIKELKLANFTFEKIL
jgi:peptidoglycan/xylan/chitin deacetylase (PgdA/CDA1 family)